MDVLLFALNLSWKILVLFMGWTLFKYVLKNGSGTFKEFLDTVGIALRTFGHWIRKVCLNYLRKESAEAEEKVDEKLSEDLDRFVTYKEFEEAIGLRGNKPSNPREPQGSFLFGKEEP